MSGLTDVKIVKEFQELDIEVKPGSSTLDRLQELGREYNLDAGQLCDEWVAFSTQHGDCGLTSENMDKFDTALRVRQRQTPTSRRAVAKTRGGGREGVMMYTQENLGELFGNEDEDDDLLGMYGGTTPKTTPTTQRGQKRQQTTPTTPGPPTKSRITQNGATPTTPRTTNGVHSSTPYKSMIENGMLSSTPAAKYNQRHNRGGVACTLNDAVLPMSWHGTGTKVKLGHYDQDSALKSPYQYMFQKVSEKALTLLERIEDFGREICHHNCLTDPLSVAQPSLEPALYTGQVLCEGEGHLNARSCLLEGPMKSLRSRGRCVKMEIPDSLSCSLFPGQIIAVEGINNYNGILIPSTIYDDGVLPPLPKRTCSSISGFTMLAAAGPFTTNDNLDMGPLRDLVDVVKREKPDVLVLLGPFVDATHPLVKECNMPGNLTFEDFFRNKIFMPLLNSLRSLKTRLVLVPSQHDVHHPWAVYPQPPFQIHVPPDFRGQDAVFSTSDPSTLDVNGLCVGMTSTDVLFHLSARTMFRGATGDRMARVARLVLTQQCYHPLLPAFRREDHAPSLPATPTPSTATKKPPTDSSLSNGTAAPGAPTDHSTELQSREEMTDVNLDLVHGFDVDYNHCTLPARPDVLLLPSDLKPFAKKIDGCVCINPGRLTKKASGGTYAKISVPDLTAIKEDFSSDIGVQIVYI